MTPEDPSASRTARESPSHQTNGHEDRVDSVSRTEETRGSTRPEHLTTGSSSAAKGSSSSVTFTNSIDVDSEYNTGRDPASWSPHSYREQSMPRYGSGSASTNSTQQECFLGRMRYRPTASSSKYMSQECDESYQMSHHSTIVDISAHGRETACSSPVRVPNFRGAQTVPTGPAAVSFHQTGSISHAEQNGYSTAPLHFDEGRSSPVPGRSRRSQKLHKALHQYETNPNQGSPPLGQESRPVLSRAERMAALERRMKANGLSAPGRTRTSPGKKRLGQGGATHVGAVQMNDGSNTSGSESSESEVENSRGNCSTPLMFSNTAEANSSSPIPRSKFSFGSLQLDEEADQDECNAFSDEECAQTFSC